MFSDISCRVEFEPQEQNLLYQNVVRMIHCMCLYSSNAKTTSELKKPSEVHVSQLVSNNSTLPLALPAERKEIRWVPSIE